MTLWTPLEYHVFVCFAFAHRSYLFEISWTLKAVHVLAKHFRGIRVFAPEFLIKKQQQNNLESTERGI